jgi:hypothetical protein
VKTAARIEFGDFQTPLPLAREIGAFLQAAAECYPHAGLRGFDIKSEYVQATAKRLNDLGAGHRATIRQEDFFRHDWDAELRRARGALLILGNLPSPAQRQYKRARQKPNSYQFNAATEQRCTMNNSKPEFRLGPARATRMIGFSLAVLLWVQATLAADGPRLKPPLIQPERGRSMRMSCFCRRRFAPVSALARSAWSGAGSSPHKGIVWMGRRSETHPGR